MKEVEPLVPSNFVRFAASALPCGARVVPFQSRSPPEAAVAPVSRLSDVPEVSVTEPVKSANAAIGNRMVRAA